MMFVRIHKTPSWSPSPVDAAAAQSVAKPVKPDPVNYVLVPRGACAVPMVPRGAGGRLKCGFGFGWR
ncbi:hypothetical protein HanPSC8_Chr09g0374061 [Helianthus annuus]|nr:hypothetical protein HanPSC8_Chr09g0374061 [Helianthus annuus]